MDIEGNQLHTVVEVPEHRGMGICWLPDGQILSVVVPYASMEKAAHFLMKIPAFGGKVEPVPLKGLPAGDGPFIGNLALSPDGKTLCFSWSDVYAQPLDLGLAPLDGSADVRLLMKNGDGPAWSPDGKRIACSSLQSKQHGIFAVGAEGGEAQLLTTREDEFSGCGSPAWSPQGDKLVFIRARSGYGDRGAIETDMKICLWDLKAGKQTDLTDKPRLYYMSPCWVKGTPK